MTEDASHEYRKAGRSDEFRQYVIGGALALALTLLAFWAAIAPDVSHAKRSFAIIFLAVVQMAVHFRFFLHIDLKRSHRDDLHLILFTTLIIAIMITGTIWILFNQHARMM